MRDQIVLDPRAPALQGEVEELLAQFEVPPAHAGALEDALRELVTGEPQAIEHLTLGERLLRVRHGERSDARAAAPRCRPKVASGRDDWTGDGGGTAG